MAKQFNIGITIFIHLTINTGEVEDESPGASDEEMDAKEDGEEEHMAEEERTEGMEGSEKQDEGMSPKVRGFIIDEVCSF